MKEEIERAKELIKQLSWDDCEILYKKLPAGSPVIDFVFDRMEEIDPCRFDAWL